MTGINIADYSPSLLDLCKRLLADLPDMKILTLSSLDPASDIISLIDLAGKDARMNRHMHLSVQSGSDEILLKMGRRHNAGRVREIMQYGKKFGMLFSWDIICGFPGECDSEFEKTLQLAWELRPQKIHAFPFSARPGTVAEKMPNPNSRKISKERVRKIMALNFA